MALGCSSWKMGGERRGAGLVGARAVHLVIAIGQKADFQRKLRGTAKLNLTWSVSQ